MSAFGVRVSLCITKREFVLQFHPLGLHTRGTAIQLYLRSSGLKGRFRSRTGFVAADIRTLRLMNLTTRAKAMDIGRSFSIGEITAKPPRLKFRHQLLTAHGSALPLFEVFGDDFHPGHQMLV
jgi:hypothetical protein